MACYVKIRKNIRDFSKTRPDLRIRRKLRKIYEIGLPR